MPNGEPRLDAAAVREGEWWREVGERAESVTSVWIHAMIITRVLKLAEYGL